MANWTHRKTISTTKSPWVTVHTEQWEDDQGQLLDYWRVERPDSVIVLPIHRGRLLLPPPVFRPGVGRVTLDFPGGRLPEATSPVNLVAPLLERELGIPRDFVAAIAPLNSNGWPVDSSFSSQCLWGYTARIAESFDPDPSRIGASVAADQDGAADLLARIECLQCRALLLQWLLDELRGTRGA